MAFCPFRSTAEKEVECSSTCNLCIIDDENEKVCGLTRLSEKLADASDQAGYLANTIRNYYPFFK